MGQKIKPRQQKFPRVARRRHDVILPQEMVFQDEGPFSVTELEDDQLANHLPKDRKASQAEKSSEEFWSDSCWQEK